jgi:hypothetical protein
MLGTEEVFMAEFVDDLHEKTFVTSQLPTVSGHLQRENDT